MGTLYRHGTDQGDFFLSFFLMRDRTVRQLFFIQNYNTIIFYKAIILDTYQWDHYSRNTKMRVFLFLIKSKKTFQVILDTEQ